MSFHISVPSPDQSDISLVQASLYSPVRVYLEVVTAALCRTRPDPDLLRPHQSASGRSPT